MHTPASVSAPLDSQKKAKKEDARLVQNMHLPILARRPHHDLVLARRLELHERGVAQQRAAHGRVRVCSVRGAGEVPGDDVVRRQVREGVCVRGGVFSECGDCSCTAQRISAWKEGEGVEEVKEDVHAASVGANTR